jgi:hypothetical protein
MLIGVNGDRRRRWNGLRYRTAKTLLPINSLTILAVASVSVILSGCLLVHEDDNDERCYSQLESPVVVVVYPEEEDEMLIQK